MSLHVMDVESRIMYVHAYILCFKYEVYVSTRYEMVTVLRTCVHT